jgi:hypothetical protein
MLLTQIVARPKNRHCYLGSIPSWVAKACRTSLVFNLNK